MESPSKEEQIDNNSDSDSIYSPTPIKQRKKRVIDDEEEDWLDYMVKCS
jgi:hypothetical protein